MRTSRYTGAVLTLIALSLHVVTPSAYAQSGATQKTLQKVVTSLGEEARNAARLYWNSVFIKCGASFYSYAGDEYYLDERGQVQWKWPKTHGANAPLEGGYAVTHAVTFLEYKGSLFGVLNVFPAALSPADRLNGLEWKGFVMTGTSVRRDRSILDVSVGWGPWSSWYDTSPLRVDLKKMHGEWWFSQGYSNEDKTVTSLKPSVESCSVKSQFLPIE